MHFSRSRYLRSLPAFSLAALLAVLLAVPALAQQRRPATGQYDSFVFEGGGGFTAPAGRTAHDVNWGWNAMGGIGFKESRDFSTIAEYQFNRFSIPSNTLAQLQEPDGNVHIWSLTLQQKINLARSDTRPYVIGGGGFYRRLISFTEPQNVVACDPFFGCFGTQQDVLLSHSSSNQGGADVGLGFEHRLSHYSNAKIFAEARYTWIDTPGRATQIVPVTFGLRF